MSNSASSGTTGTQLLDRAVAILQILGERGNDGASMTELGDELQLKQSTAHRIVTALQRHGLVEREQKTKRFRLGLALFAMGARAADGTGLRRLARPALMRLSSATGDPTFLMARAGFNAICVDRQEGGYFIDSLTGNIGGEIPLGVGPASLAILAFLPPEEAEAIVSLNAVKYNNYGSLTTEKVREQIIHVRENGYAVDNGILVQGISAFAIPVLPQGRDAIAAIAVNMTTPRLSPERLPKLLNLLRAEVSQIEKVLNPLDRPLASF